MSDFITGVLTAPETIQAFTTLFIIVITAAIGFVGRAVNGWVNANKNDKNVDFLLKLATIGVQAAEQLYETGDGAAKQAYAMEFIEKELQKRHIPLDIDAIATAVEAAVLQEFN